MKTLYENYTTNDLYLDKPCYVDGVGFIYPLKVKEFIGFNERYWNYLGYSEEVIDSFDMKFEGDYFFKLMGLNMAIKLGETADKNNVGINGNVVVAISQDIADMLSLVTHKKIEVLVDEKHNIIFGDKDKTIVINTGNYDIVRQVINKQNLIGEMKYYEDLEYGQLMREMRERMNKENNILPTDFVEMVSIVKTYNKFTMEQILNENVFQLYCDWATLSNLEDYRTTMNFKLVDMANSIKAKPILSPFIEDLYAESDDSDLISQVDLDGNNF